MSLLYLISAGIAFWLLWQIFSDNRPKKSGKLNATYGIPITIKETHATDENTKSTHTDDDKDHWEGSFWEVQQPFPAKATLRINYEDGAGKQTERVVDVRQFGAYVNANILIGHCRMRNSTRTFRTDRIIRCVDDETGELVSDVFAYLRGKYDSSPERTRDSLVVEEYDALRVLLYVGKADGQLRAAEKAIIQETCRALAHDSRITDVMIDEIFANLAAPTLHAFKLAVGRIGKTETAARTLLMKAAEDMVATQKTVHLAEKEALEYMRQRLFGAASPSDKAL